MLGRAQYYEILHISKEPPAKTTKKQEQAR
jgi:hypothetical protein